MQPRRSGSLLCVVCGLALLLTACPNDSGTGTQSPIALRVEPVVSGLSNPLLLTAPAFDPRLFIVEQPGRIRIVENGALLPTSFLDLVGQISSGGERGLLGLAFHPSYAANGFFYVYYTAPNGDITVERYTVSADPNLANEGSAHLILSVAHSTQTNHNGGMLAFGTDGKLYIGTGDGGGGGDPDENGQNPNTLLGKLLRLDVDAGDPYAIPPDNPFVGTPGARGEIWALGLRNPWRWAFDRTAGRLYIADVGQSAWEEVNVVSATTAGANYGWDIMEGFHCYEPSSGCDQSGLTLPVIEYGHAEGCSITGGFVYRGAAIPSLQGTYFYADYCDGWVRSFRYANGAATEQREWAFGSLGSILSFGEGADGELYILSANGTVYQIIPAP
ncbi:MAG: PQQ-dependent sugar dehydrogenase [Nitrospirota bacterium]